MPNELLLKSESKMVNKTEDKKDTKGKVEQSNSLVAMRVSLEEERQDMMISLQETMTNESKTTEEKNNAYEQLKYLNQIQGKEEDLEKEIKEVFNLDSFIKIDNSNISVVVVSEKHDKKLANDIMRLVQAKYKEKMYITVKFQKS